MKNLKYTALLPLFFAIGCLDSLAVENSNQPGKEKVVVTSGDVANLIGGAYLTYWLATEQWGGPLGLTTVADEHTSSWGNQGMKDISSEPRVKFDNSTSYGSRAHVEVPWFGLYSAIASVNDGLRAINDPDNPVMIGTGGKDNPRAIAFGKFVQGVSYGFLGAFFDQAYIIDETTDLAALALDPTLVPLSPYADVMSAAIGYLEEAITIADAAAAFETPSAWVFKTPMTNAVLAQVAHSYIARYTAAVARTPVERAAVIWADVKTHAALGIGEGEEVWGPWGDGYISWISDWRWMSGVHGWARADYHTIGLTDNSGGYTNWLATSLEQRTEFVITTDDRRIHGASPDTVITPADTTDDGVITPSITTITPWNETPGTHFEYAGPSPFQSSRGTYHYSMYEPKVWKPYAKTEAEQMMTISYVEMQLLIAEAEWRVGSKPAAAVIVNVTREAAGLPALDGDEADFFKWLTYEKKIETFAVGPGLAFFDRRGWLNTNGEALGETDLIVNSPLHFPVPAKELEIGQLSVYTHGGTSGDFAAKQMLRTRINRRMKD